MKFVLCIKNSVLNIKNALCIKTLSSLYFPPPDLIHGSSFRRLFRENKVPRIGDRFSTCPVLWGFLFVDPICKLHSLTHSVLKKIFIFIDLSVAALGLCCCTWVFSSCRARASHCGDFSCGAQAVGVRVHRRCTVVVAGGLSSCGTRALENRLRSCGALA